MLSKRLNAILNLVSNNDVIGDIGCDHGKLSCELILSHKASKVYACDVNQAPLNQAIQTINNLNLNDVVYPILSNGLNKLPDDTNSIIIAGMGFETCRMILENDMNKVLNLNEIVVQINRDVIKMREWLSDHHFTIIDEDIVFDYQYYIIIKFNTNYHDSYDRFDLDLGPILKNKVTDTYRDYLLIQKNKIQDNISKITNDINRINKLNSYLTNINELLNKDCID